MDTAHFMELCKNGNSFGYPERCSIGADVNTLDDHLRTPLMVAIRFKSLSRSHLFSHSVWGGCKC